MAGNGRLAFALFPTIAICRRRSPFQFTFMSFVADSGTFRATTKAVSEAACSVKNKIELEVFIHTFFFKFSRPNLPVLA